MSILDEKMIEKLNNLLRFDTHAHSEFSNIRLIDSINKIPDMIKTTYQLGYSGFTLTDHECVCGYEEVLETEQELKEKGVIPENFKCGLGNEIYLVEDRNNIEKYWHYILIAKNNEGCRALRELSSTAWYYSFTSRRITRVPTQMNELEAIVKKYPNSLIATNACFRKGTLVKTKNGDKKIEDITSNDYILNKYGEWEKVNFPTNRLYKGDGKEITFLENPIPTICTDNHKFLVTTSNKITEYKNTGKIPYEWIEAKDLITKSGSTKHIFLYPLANIQYNKSNIIKKNEWKNCLRSDNYFTKKNINPEIKITPEVMRFFGLWLGNGSISINKNTNCYSINFTFSIEEFNYYWEGFFRKASEEIGIDWSITKREEYHRVDASSHSVEAVELFYYLFGNNKANTKYIPDRLKHISKELDFNLFIGYQLADGYFRTREIKGYNYGEFCSVSISEQLTKDFQDLLKTLGIRSSITIHKENITNGAHHQKSYYLSGNNKAWTFINKKSIITNDDILNYMNIAIQHDSKKHIEIEGILYKKVYIKKIKKIELNERVYCLNVNSHSFCSNGVIVHNCIGGFVGNRVLSLVKEEKAECPDQNRIYQLKKEINDFILWNKKLFGEDFYIEFAAGSSKDQRAFNSRIKDIAKAYNCKLIIGSDAHYLTAKQRAAHKGYLNSKEGEREVDEFYWDAHFMTAVEAFENIQDFFTIEEYKEICNNSMEIYDKISGYNLKHTPIIPEVEVKIYPKANFQIGSEYPILNKLLNSDEVQERYWVNQCIESLIEKKLYNETYMARLETEADIIDTVGHKLNNILFKYFNTFQHYIDLFWECDTIVGPGRGSATCFLSNYLLGIVQLDAVEWGLPEWRFLNKDRVELPKN